jgi:hypothetical protein
MEVETIVGQRSSYSTGLLHRHVRSEHRPARLAKVLILILVGYLVATTGAAAAVDCSLPAIAQARQQFRQTYAAQDFGGAEDILSALRNDCITGKNVDSVLAAEIASDYALTAHRNGDDDVCINALAGYSPWQRPPTAAMAKLPERLRRAIMFNYKLCEPWCTGVDHYTDASCASLRVQQGLDKMLPGDFAEKPCTFDTGGSPTLALADGSCLAVYAPPNGRAKSEDDEKDPASVCPRVARVLQKNGAVVADTLDVPAQSMLRRPVLCCVPIDLAMDHGGRIEVTPSDNPPEDCHSGHRAAPQQDILRLRNTRLVLEHRLDVGND